MLSCDAANGDCKQSEQMSVGCDLDAALLHEIA